MKEDPVFDDGKVTTEPIELEGPPQIEVIIGQDEDFDSFKSPPDLRYAMMHRVY